MDRPIGLGCMRMSTEAHRDDDRALAVLAAALDAGVGLLDTADAYALDDADAGHNERLVARALADKRVRDAAIGERQAADTVRDAAIGERQAADTGVRDAAIGERQAADTAVRDAAIGERQAADAAVRDAAIAGGHASDVVVRDATTADGRGPDKHVRVVTKGGLVRPDGAWVPDGRAKHLAAAARASRERLGEIDLYLLHAIDPKTPLSTSVRALAKLRDDGVVRGIGLSNVTLTQLDEALALTTIDGVEVEINPWKLDAIRGGLVARCEERGILILAHRPLGGPAGVKRAARDAVLKQIAARAGATPHEVVLAWLRTLSPMIVPIPGATRIETALGAVRGGRLLLDDEARAALAMRFLDVAASTVGSRSGEIVVIAGMPGSGKSTLAEDYVARGFVRLNRDERGGSLAHLAKAVDKAIGDGAERVVVDNTYASRASRAPLVSIAKRHGMTIRCIAVTTPLEHAQANACARMLKRYDRLLEGREFGGPGNIAPNVQFKYRRDYEPPKLDEGFASVEEHLPARIPMRGGRGLIVELDGVVWKGRPTVPDKIELLPGAREALRAWRVPIAGTTWQPGAEPVATTALEARLRELLDLPIDVLACAHPAGPPICWCRKPLPGLALVFAKRRELDLAKTLHVGKQAADRGFALRAGMPYVDISEGWPDPDDPLPAVADP